MVLIIFAQTVNIAQFDDDGSGASKNLWVYRPPKRELKLGSCSFKNYFGQTAQEARSSIVYRAYFTDENEKRDVPGGERHWEKFWVDTGSWDSKDYTVWKIKDSSIPEGFVCLSPFFFKSGHPRVAPTDSEIQGMVFVAASLCRTVDDTSFVEGWNDKGTYASQAVRMFFSTDNIGYQAFRDYTTTVDTAYALDYQNDQVRLVQTYKQLTQSVLSRAQITLQPQNPIGDRYVMSMSQAKMTSVFTGNETNRRKYAPNAYDCEDFAAEMRAAVARACYDDSVSNAMQVGCFCGIAYLIHKKRKIGHGCNLFLNADGTCSLFDAQTGEFVDKKFKPLYNIIHVYY